MKPEVRIRRGTTAARPRSWGKRKKMDHNTAYLSTNYAMDKMIEQYHREEKEKITAKEEKGATARAGIMIPPAPEKDDDRQNN